MKGLILSGGKGSRLNLFTRRVANKHVALVYDRPMIEFPTSLLSQAGCIELAVVVGSMYSGDVMRVLGDGKEFGFDRATYLLQKEEDGIASALKLAEGFVGKDSFAMILGDNIFEKSVQEDLASFKKGARVFLKEVSDPERFGVAELQDGKVIGLEEKPKAPKSNYAVTGLYLFDHTAFDRAKKLKYSNRKELEIVDVLKSYMEDGLLDFRFVDGFWSDSGTVESLLYSSQWVKDNNESLVAGGRFSKYMFDLGDDRKGDYLTRIVNS